MSQQSIRDTVSMAYSVVRWLSNIKVVGSNHASIQTCIFLRKGKNISDNSPMTNFHIESADQFINLHKKYKQWE